MKLTDYHINQTEKYWPIKTNRYPDNPDHAENIQFTTLTVHEPTCRIVKRDRMNRPVGKQNHLDSTALDLLLSFGLSGPRARYQDTAWQGCKICGTASDSYPADYWQGLAKETIDARRAAKDRQHKQRQAEQAKHNAQYARTIALQDAVHAWITTHDDEIEAVKVRAAAQWAAENPEQAALLSEENADGAH